MKRAGMPNVAPINVFESPPIDLMTFRYKDLFGVKRWGAEAERHHVMRMYMLESVAKADRQPQIFRPRSGLEWFNLVGPYEPLSIYLPHALRQQNLISTFQVDEFEVDQAQFTPRGLPWVCPDAKRLGFNWNRSFEGGAAIELQGSYSNVCDNLCRTGCVLHYSTP